MLPLLQAGGNQRVGCLWRGVSMSTRSSKTPSHGYYTTGSLTISTPASTQPGSVIIQPSNETISDYIHAGHFPYSVINHNTSCYCLHFIDEKTVSRGFKVIYTHTCGARIWIQVCLTQSPGSITSPAVYHYRRRISVLQKSLGVLSPKHHVFWDLYFLLKFLWTQYAS